jgi:anti-sigma B factor antagonist
MPESANSSVYLVDAESDPVVIRIEGRANFKNCGSLRDFVMEMCRRGRTRFVLDFRNCESMDSTFLGVVAGAAIELRKPATQGSLVASRLGERNLELIRNLGLHRLLTVDMGTSGPKVEQCTTALGSAAGSEAETARLVLKAHEDLVNADEGNRAKFQDVLTFLRNRVEQK